MAKKLTGTEAAWSHAVLHDIFEAGGLIKSSSRTYSYNNIKEYGSVDSAKAICDEIKFRNFDFPKLDIPIRTIAARSFNQLHEPGRKLLTENQIANIIAAFCAEKEIFWDDVNTLRTTVEMETYAKSTLGKACLNFKCFLSQQSKTKTTASRSKTIDPSTGKAVPTSGYKSSGPKSGIIKGLIGEPGEKIILPKSDTLFVIVCDSAKKKKQYVFIDPLSPITEVNKIRFGDPSGWSCCKVFFDSMLAADEAIEAIKSGSFRVLDGITGFHIERQKADPNGYFKVNTELGAVYVKASKLNEALEEALAEETAATSEIRRSRYPEINDIDLYAEALQYRE
jgi:hypothetical protein